MTKRCLLRWSPLVATRRLGLAARRGLLPGTADERWRTIEMKPATEFVQIRFNKCGVLFCNYLIGIKHCKYAAPVCEPLIEIRVPVFC